MEHIDSLIDQLEQQKANIERAIEALRGGTSVPRRYKHHASKKRTMSAAARKRIGDATRKRWAERRKAAKAAAKKP
jgi:hypothetical protein